MSGRSVSNDVVERPAHYTFSDIEPIQVVEAWGLSFHLGSVIKYLARAGRKGDRVLDLRKAEWFLRREIERLQPTSAGHVEQPTDDSDSPEICSACNGTGTSRFSHRPDDHGPHLICETCRGTGIAAS